MKILIGIESNNLNRKSIMSQVYKTVMQPLIKPKSKKTVVFGEIDIFLMLKLEFTN